MTTRNTGMRPVTVAMPSPSSQVVKLPPLHQSNRQRLSPRSVGNPGMRSGDGQEMHGGGGPENRGARSSDAVAISFAQNQPSWMWEDLHLNEYTGPAAPSTTPMLAGIPSNAFRLLGDAHGGRQ